jgi:hypothetical protein
MNGIHGIKPNVSSLHPKPFLPSCISLVNDLERSCINAESAWRVMFTSYYPGKSSYRRESQRDHKGFSSASSAVKLPFMDSRWSLLLVTALLLAACAAVPKPVSLPVPGKEVDTLQSPVSIAVKAGGKSIGGRGYLVYQRPDRFHLVLLSPFGLTLFEIFTAGDRITCLIPSKETAYDGNVNELPDQSALRSWGLMRWVAERPPATGPVPGVRNGTAPDGRRELVTYDERGLIQMKEDEDGNRVTYGDYTGVNGVALPATVVISDRRGDTVRIVFDEPEVNQPVDESALTPRLEGMTVLPLSDFRGM